MRFTSAIRKLDKYGVKPTFNINQSGTEVTTFFGGLVSLFVMILTYSYLGQLLYTMFNLDKNALGSSFVNIDLAKEGEVKFSDMNMLIFFTMKSTKPKSLLLPKTYDPAEFNQYLNIDA